MGERVNKTLEIYNKKVQAFLERFNSPPTPSDYDDDFLCLEASLRWSRNLLKRFRSIFVTLSELFSYNLPHKQYKWAFNSYNTYSSLYFSALPSLAEIRTRFLENKRVRNKEFEISRTTMITPEVVTTPESPADSPINEPIIRHLPIVIRIANKKKRRHHRKNRNLRTFILSVSYFYSLFVQHHRFHNLIFAFFFPLFLDLFLFSLFDFSPHVVNLDFLLVRKFSLRNKIIFYFLFFYFYFSLYDRMGSGIEKIKFFLLA